MKLFVEQFVDVVGKFIVNIEEVFYGMIVEVKVFWDEIKFFVLESVFNYFNWFIKFKFVCCCYDWDYVVKGVDVQKFWVQGESGEDYCQVDGKFVDFNFCVKVVDLFKFGVDKVKQYSGYLDDEVNDKYLFYCMFCYF